MIAMATPSHRDLARACTLPSCSAPPGQPCVKKDGTPFDRTHVDRRAPDSTGSLAILRPETAWDGRERRTGRHASESATDAARRVMAWISTLPAEDPRKAGAMAAMDVIRGGR